MKLYSALLALSALNGAAAFAPQAPTAFKTSLESSVNGDPTTGLKSGLEQNVNTGAIQAKGANANLASIWDSSTPIKVQGNSLKTWSFLNPAVERVQVEMSTEGRPLDADIELWQGPDNTPHKMRVYIEDGALRPFKATIETPRGPNTVSIRNIGHLEFPLDACVEADAAGNSVMDPYEITQTSEKGGQVIQGGALKTYPFDPMVESVAVLLATDGRPLNSRIELLQGPNNNKEVIEVYTEDGMDRPFFIVLESPGSGNVVRICNTSTMEFPLTAWVGAHKIGNPGPGSDVVIS